MMEHADATTPGDDGGQPAPTSGAPTRAGHVALVGAPNAGKSTLLNHLLGARLAITSPKPQSTRIPAVGILSTDRMQAVLLDTPGLLDPGYALQRSLLTMALDALGDADVAVHVHDATAGPPPRLASLLPEGARIPRDVVTWCNKADQLSDEARAALVAARPDSLVGSAATGAGVAALLEGIEAALPLSPFLYPDDELSTQPMRFFATEAIREAAFEVLQQEVPYGVLAEIEEFREERDPLYVRAVLYVERDSQKGIVLGAKGRTIREIGTRARGKLEQLVERQVYLDLWVKVLGEWRRDPRALRRFGFTVPPDPPHP
jgi:GTP-binding protein Era